MTFLMMAEMFAQVESCLAFGTFVMFLGLLRSHLLRLSKMKGVAQVLAMLAIFTGRITWVVFLMLTRL